jgi:hypothetical protein
VHLLEYFLLQEQMEQLRLKNGKWKNQLIVQNHDIYSSITWNSSMAGISKQTEETWMKCWKYVGD